MSSPMNLVRPFEAARPESRQGPDALCSESSPNFFRPAGDRTCLLAAVENGADAVYFGLQRHNARIRATNFDGAELAEIMALLHRRGVRGYVTLNTLVFPDELADVEATVRELVDGGRRCGDRPGSGPGAADPGDLPDLEIHASTQMSITSEEGIRLAAELGCSRVILARELSLDEIKQDSQPGRAAASRSSSTAPSAWPTRASA